MFSHISVTEIWLRVQLKNNVKILYIICVQRKYINTKYYFFSFFLIFLNIFFNICLFCILEKLTIICVLYILCKVYYVIIYQVCYFVSQISVAGTNCHSSKPMSRDNKLVTDTHRRQFDFDPSLCRERGQKVWRYHDEDSSKFVQGVSQLPSESKLRPVEGLMRAWI